jgi:hypothetical protein
MMFLNGILSECIIKVRDKTDEAIVLDHRMAIANVALRDLSSIRTGRTIWDTISY